ncbi:MAG: PEP-CTERM sorting domain-containing protein [Bryobacteraceae bacterium]
MPAAPVQWMVGSGGNGHWYEYVPAISIFSPVSFDTARAAALASTHMGMAGYLATVTSAGEQAFIENSFSFLLGFGATGTAFLGASDNAVQGEFRWLEGPEAGQLVSYTNWLPGYPNTSGDILQLYINAATLGAPPLFGWINGDPGALGYVIEYSGTGDGGVPEPGTLWLVVGGVAALAWRRSSGTCMVRKINGGTSGPSSTVRERAAQLRR